MVGGEHDVKEKNNCEIDEFIAGNEIYTNEIIKSNVFTKARQMMKTKVVPSQKTDTLHFKLGHEVPQTRGNKQTFVL